ncbi:helix-turn-helix domain-containing protein [Lysinibacillus capsici]|uniref:helix-turn-helix domain-containing protein n=1 Tax=Lysinibacillus capsici TaxID=2115968 RepID=UPI001CD9AA7C|nr:helix-turn-helix transcriptional regulator [Lysinibacillus capsici]
MAGFIHCNLRVLMAERGLNIQNVKDQTTLSRTTISNLYNNYGSGIQFDTLTQLCTLLKCTPGDLFTFVNLSVSFDDITSDHKVDTLTDLFVADPVEGYGHEYISLVKATFKINFKLKYEEQTLNFAFCVDTSTNLDEHKNVVNIKKDISEIFQVELDNLSLKVPVYVIDYIEEQLDQFLLDCINDLINTF